MGPLLTVPEAVAFATEQARQRGDTRAQLMAQDIRKDIGNGRIVLGQDAFWLASTAHPKGGHWVVTVQAIERRISERLRGPGRPRKQPGPEEVRGEGEEKPPDLPLSTIVTGPKGPEPFPVADPIRYREALRSSLEQLREKKGMFYVCTCGWAGVGNFLRACPSCGRDYRGAGDIAYVSAVARELLWIQRNLTEMAARTRNEKWATEMRRHRRHLELLAAQAALEEPITPGVQAAVATLMNDAATVLSESLILPAILRTMPDGTILTKLAAATVEPAAERTMLRFRIHGKPCEDVLPAVRQEGGGALARAILAGHVPPDSVFPTIRWLVEDRKAISDRFDLPYRDRQLRIINSLLSRLLELPPHDLQQACSVERQVNRGRAASRDFVTAGREWAAEFYGQNRPQWDRYGKLAEDTATLRDCLHGYLMEEARSQVSTLVGSEVDRLELLARAEAKKTGKDPLTVLARWVRRKTPPHFTNDDLMRMAAYPLAQRLGTSAMGMPTQPLHE